MKNPKNILIILTDGSSFHYNVLLVPIVGTALITPLNTIKEYIIISRGVTNRTFYANFLFYWLIKLYFYINKIICLTHFVLKFHLFFDKIQNDRKGRYTLANFWEKWKKSWKWSLRIEKYNFSDNFSKNGENSALLGTVTLIFTFLHFSQKISQIISTLAI